MEPVMDVRETAVADLGTLLDAGDGAVVTLVAGETRLAAHKAVLSARSPVFAAMFNHDTLEATSGRVTIQDVEGHVLRQLLVYMYTLQTIHLASMAPQLLAAADKYGLPVLKSACEQQLAAQLNVETAAATAVLALRHSCTSLKQAAIDFIKSHTHRVMATQGSADSILSDPPAVVELTRMIGESSSENSSSATVERMPSTDTGSQPRKDVGRPPVAAASPATPPSDDVAVSRMRSLPAEEKGRRLIAAAKQGAVGELRSLLAAGADTGARDEQSYSNTALHWAAREGHVEAARCLLDGGAEVDAREIGQKTPLHLAAGFGQAAVVRLLVASSADVNARDRLGWTPLHGAVRNGKTEAAAALLEVRADRRIRDNEGRTPLDLARAKNKQDLVVMLS